MSYQKTIIRPLFTEKISRLEDEERKYAFQVEKGVNKIEIKREIEEKFDFGCFFFVLRFFVYSF